MQANIRFMLDVVHYSVIVPSAMLWLAAGSLLSEAAEVVSHEGLR